MSFGHGDQSRVDMRIVPDVFEQISQLLLQDCHVLLWRHCSVSRSLSLSLRQSRLQLVEFGGNSVHFFLGSSGNSLCQLQMPCRLRTALLRSLQGSPGAVDASSDRLCLGNLLLDRIRLRNQ